MADKLSRREVLSSFGLTGLGLLASNVQANTDNSLSLIKEGENMHGDTASSVTRQELCGRLL